MIRTRRKNDAVYQYSKVSTYCSTYQWDFMHARALNMKVSFSLLVDIALRMYLTQVLRLLLGLPLNRGGKWAMPYLQLLRPGNYQKTVIVDKPRALSYTISWDLGPPSG